MSNSCIDYQYHICFYCMSIALLCLSQYCSMAMPKKMV